MQTQTKKPHHIELSVGDTFDHTPALLALQELRADGREPGPPSLVRNSQGNLVVVIPVAPPPPFAIPV